MQEGLTGCGEVDQASMIFGCYHGLTVVTRMRCQGRKGEGKGSSRIVKSAFFSARPLFEGIRNVCSSAFETTRIASGSVSIASNRSQCNTFTHFGPR